MWSSPGSDSRHSLHFCLVLFYGRFTFTVPSGGIWGVSVSPDSRTALLGVSDWSSETAKPGDIILWDLQTGDELRRFTGQPTPVGAVAFSPDGNTFLSGGMDALFLWNVETGEIIRDFRIESQVFDIAFSPDGSMALSGSDNGEVILWKVQTGDILHRLVGQQGFVSNVMFGPDGQTAASAGDNGVYLWNLATGTSLHHFPDSLSVAFNPDGQLLLIGAQDRTNRLWNMTTQTTVRQFLDVCGAIFSPAFSPDGRSILANFWDGRVELWRVDTLDELIAWTQVSRYIPELTCDQRQLYRIKPLCEQDAEE